MVEHLFANPNLRSLVRFRAQFHTRVMDYDEKYYMHMHIYYSQIGPQLPKAVCIEFLPPVVFHLNVDSILLFAEL